MWRKPSGIWRRGENINGVAAAIGGGSEEIWLKAIGQKLAKYVKAAQSTSEASLA